MSEFTKYASSGSTQSLSLAEVKAAEIMVKGDIEEAMKLVLENGCSRFSSSAFQMRTILALRKSNFDEVNALMPQLMAVKPDAIAFKMKGDGEFLQRRYDEAEKCYAEALRLDPDNAEVVHDLGVAIVSQGRVAESITHFRRSVEMLPGRADFRHHLGIMLVLNGDEKEGWDEMGWRLNVPGVCGTYPHPEKYWKGESLEGKTLVLRTEQGWGDTIQFAGYLPELIRRADRVYVYCQRPMLGFLEHYFPQAVCWPNDAPPPLDFDYHVNLMCLPRLMPEHYQAPKARLAPGAGTGVCWFGSPTHKADHLRTVEIERFAPLAAAVGGNLACLGYGRFDNKPPFIEYVIDRCHDWLDTARVVEKLNLVITVDTAIAHLCGFLGVETWLLLPYVPDFRWGLKGERTKWYDSLKLYRQPALFDWDSVFARVEKDLIARQQCTPFFASAVSEH